jgi:hypothetical protein
MDMTARAVWTLMHGMGFGALYLLACSGAILELVRFTTSSAHPEPTRTQYRFLNAYLLAMVFLAWAAVFTGTYIIYPWYRAIPPPDALNLSLFPQHMLQASAATAGWHSLGMEWKEHVAWFAPISITAVAFIFIRYGRHLHNHRQLRSAVLGFAAAAFAAAAIAAFFGAMINKAAPVEGGPVIHISHPSQE